jgi:hypothetical protein
MPHELVRHMGGLGPACLRAEREDVNKSRGVRRDTEAGHPSPRAIYQRRRDSCVVSDLSRDKIGAFGGVC